MTHFRQIAVFRQCNSHFFHLGLCFFMALVAQNLVGPIFVIPRIRSSEVEPVVDMQGWRGRLILATALALPFCRLEKFKAAFLPAWVFQLFRIGGLWHVTSKSPGSPLALDGMATIPKERSGQQGANRVF